MQIRIKVPLERGQTASFFEGDNGWLIEFQKIWELPDQLINRQLLKKYLTIQRFM
jgi:hypothetical protein